MIVEAFIPVFMNSCRGVAFHRDSVDMDETEITNYMADQDVIEAQKITMMDDGNRRSTASVFLTFRLLERIHERY